MKKLLIILVVLITTGCKSLSQEEPKPTYEIEGMYVESNIDRPSMGAVRLLIEEDSMYRGWTHGEFIKQDRGAYKMADTIEVEFRSYGPNQVGGANQAGTEYVIFYNFRIVSKLKWNGDTLIYAYTEWKADEWEGLKFTSIFTKLK